MGQKVRDTNSPQEKPTQSNATHRSHCHDLIKQMEAWLFSPRATLCHWTSWPWLANKQLLGRPEPEGCGQKYAATAGEADCEQLLLGETWIRDDWGEQAKSELCQGGVSNRCCRTSTRHWMTWLHKWHVLKILPCCDQALGSVTRLPIRRYGRHGEQWKWCQRGAFFERHGCHRGTSTGDRTDMTSGRRQAHVNLLIDLFFVTMHANIARHDRLHIDSLLA